MIKDCNCFTCTGKQKTLDTLSLENLKLNERLEEVIKERNAQQKARINLYDENERLRKENNKVLKENEVINELTESNTAYFKRINKLIEEVNILRNENTNNFNIIEQQNETIERLKGTIRYLETEVKKGYSESVEELRVIIQGRDDSIKFRDSQIKMLAATNLELVGLKEKLKRGIKIRDDIIAAGSRNNDKLARDLTDERRKHQTSINLLNNFKDKCDKLEKENIDLSRKLDISFIENLKKLI